MTRLKEQKTKFKRSFYNSSAKQCKKSVPNNKKKALENQQKKYKLQCIKFTELSEYFTKMLSTHVAYEVHIN